jgi:hypothetical protein
MLVRLFGSQSSSPPLQPSLRCTMASGIPAPTVDLRAQIIGEFLCSPHMIPDH